MDELHHQSTVKVLYLNIRFPMSFLLRKYEGLLYAHEDLLFYIFPVLSEEFLALNEVPFTFLPCLFSDALLLLKIAFISPQLLYTFRFQILKNLIVVIQKSVLKVHLFMPPKSLSQAILLFSDNFKTAQQAVFSKHSSGHHEFLFS